MKIKNILWKIKMIWFHGITDALEIFRVNARVFQSNNASQDASDFDYLNTFTGRGWFGLFRSNKND